MSAQTFFLSHKSRTLRCGSLDIYCDTVTSYTSQPREMASMACGVWCTFLPNQKNKLIFLKGLHVAFPLFVNLAQLSHHWRNQKSIANSSYAVKSTLGRTFRILLRVFGGNDVTYVARSPGLCPLNRRSDLLRMETFSVTNKIWKIVQR